MGRCFGVAFEERGGLSDYALDTRDGFAALQEFDEVSDVDQQGGHLKEPSGAALFAERVTHGQYLLSR